MRQILIVGIVSVLAVLGLQNVAAQAPLLVAQVDQKAAKDAKKAKNKRVCRYVRETGSRIRERVCRKQKDWDRMEERAKENVRDAYDGSNRNTTGAGQT
ncbi:MAG: hypothetical protein AAF541_22145 [Pseudomonadota bacterium]